MSDPWSAHVVFLLHMDGSNGSQVFTDSSYSAKTITAAGNAQISTAQAKFGGSSGYFDGSGDYLSLPSDSAWAFGTGDFTVEMFVRAAAPPGGGNNFDSLLFGGFSTPAMVFFLTNNANAPALWDGTNQLTATTAVPTNAWAHVAFTRASGTLRMFVDGVGCYSASHSINFTGTSPMTIGGVSGSRYLNGFLDELRITKGIARYTADFTPPAAPFDIDPISGLILPSPLLADIYDGGAYRVTGTVDELGVPGSYRVRLHERQSGRLVRETWSAADGAFSIPNLAYRQEGYYAVVHDNPGSPRNALIADLVTPEVMI